MAFKRRKGKKSSRSAQQLLGGRGSSRCPFKREGIKEIDYKDVALLNKYIGSDGKIVSARVSGVSALMQRKLANAIKRARYLSLIPYTDHHSLIK